MFDRALRGIGELEHPGEHVPREFLGAVSPGLQWSLPTQCEVHLPHRYRSLSALLKFVRRDVRESVLEVMGDCPRISAQCQLVQLSGIKSSLALSKEEVSLVSLYHSKVGLDDSGVPGRDS